MSVLWECPCIVKQIEKLIRDFIWKENMSDGNFFPLISLREMSFDKGASGVGVQDMNKRNVAFDAQLV